MNIKQARKIDFTGQLPGFQHFPRFNDEVTRFLRLGGSEKTVVVVDRAVGPKLAAPSLVVDHLNLTGCCPLVGPNDPCGPRFPVVNGIYVAECESLETALPQLGKIVAAGLKDGVEPDADEVQLLKFLGADAFCYNTVPTMIVAAHAGYKVLALLLPQAAKATKELVEALS
ncbi:MAG TPA: hypothetical protein V6D08_00690 [Candidatus Obscuribacterales bacterium]